MSIVAEEWRPVVGFEESHRVSNLGRVKSIPRQCRRKDGRPYFMRHEKIRRQCFAGCGYKVVSIAGMNRYVHALVLEAFVGPRPEGFDACHNNGNKTDNRLENLRWDTKSANSLDKRRHGTMLRGEKHPKNKLTEVQAREILASPEMGVALAAKYGVSECTVCEIRTGRKWKHLLPQEAVA